MYVLDAYLHVQQCIDLGAKCIDISVVVVFIVVQCFYVCVSSGLATQCREIIYKMGDIEELKQLVNQMAQENAKLLQKNNQMAQEKGQAHCCFGC